MDVGGWLRNLGLGKYEAAFRDNAIDEQVLRHLTAEDLKEIGVVTVGDRRKLLAAIAELAAPWPSAAPLSPPSAAQRPKTPDVSAERRPITVMFCDLVGSTSLAAKLDAEDWRNLVNAYLDEATKAVTGLGGYVLKRLGDGLMALFGYPHAQENDAERAVRAALAIQHGLADINARNSGKGQPELSARIGLESGPVVVETSGEVFGEAPNIAARVQAAAEPGTVLVTSTVQRQIAGLFIVEDKGAHELKGVPTPVTLCRICRVSGGRRRTRLSYSCHGRAHKSSASQPLPGGRSRLFPSESGSRKRGERMTNTTAGRIATAGVVLALTTIGSRAETIELPTFDVVATTPLGGGEIDVAKSPFAVWQTNAQDIQTFNDTTLPDTLARQTPGVTVGNISGNDFQPDVSYRGFDATAVTGTPIGLAVYQNGVRINEAFGDTVNWDLIPENAIDRTAIIAGNPIFGLNALGGAVTVTMKNGFTWQGFQADLRGGSFGRAQEEVQYGKQVGDWSVYAAATQINDGGWRVDGASQLSNFYGDVGYKANGFEVASAAHRGGHPVRRRRFHAAPIAAEQLGQRLHRSADDLQQDGDGLLDRQLRLLAYVEFPGQRLFPRIQSGACRRQSDGRGALPASLMPERKPGA